MFRSLLLLLLSLLLCGCGGGGGGSTSSQAEEAAGHRLQVRVNTGVINPQTIGPLSTITRVRVELLVFGTGSEYLPALEVPVDAANFSAVAVFSPVSQGRYTLRASGFNSMGTLVAGPITSDVDVAPGLSSAASLLLQVPPVEKDFLFVAAADEIHVFESDPTTGVLTPNASSPFAAPTGSRPDELVSGPDGRFLYSNFFSLNQIARYEIDPATGSLTFLDTVPTGNVPSGMTVDPQKEFLYVPNRLDGTVGVFRVDQTTGALTETPNSPFAVAGATNPQRAYTDPQGRFLFVTDFFLNGELFVMKIDRTSGDLTQTVGPFQAFPVSPLPFRTFAVTTDPQGTILYVSGNFPEIAVYDIDQTTGFLTPRGNVPVASNNLGELVFDDQRSVLYALGFSDDVIRTYQIDVNGDIGAEITGSPVLTGGIDPLTLLLTPDGTRLYIGNFQITGQTSAFLPDANGLPVPVTGQPFASGFGPFGLEFLRLQSFP